MRIDSECDELRNTPGFHTRIRELDQLSNFQRRCESILRDVELLFRATRCAAPMRKDNFCLLRDFPGTVPRGEEAKWERAMWRQWGPAGAGGQFLSICPRLQTYQYPLRSVQPDAAWGKVDLLGVGPDYQPVVVELKRGGSSDTVLLMLLEMVAYGIALRKVWPNLRPHWEHAMESSWQHQGSAPTELGRVTLIGVAPPRYWALQGTDPTGPAGRVPRRAWACFCELVAEISRRGDFSVAFARVHERLPDDATVEPSMAPVRADASTLFAGHPRPVRAETTKVCS